MLLARPELCMTEDHLTCCSQSPLVVTFGIEQRPNWWRAGDEARLARLLHRPSCAEVRGPSMLLAALIIVIIVLFDQHSFKMLNRDPIGCYSSAGVFISAVTSNVQETSESGNVNC
ncbi:hypothetical protein XENOCAPTIV_014417 [Xenoophorus captivus]|uniref:Uncharacterized protein n=1 Tax=Xenoophorus captivus TaxID=1517983 RepID=A0ABV0SGE6_9TELE